MRRYARYLNMDWEEERILDAACYMSNALAKRGHEKVCWIFKYGLGRSKEFFVLEIMWEGVDL